MTEEYVAIKCIKKDSITEKAKLEELLINEIQVLSSIKSENVVRLFEVRKTQSHIYLIMEFCDGGSLEELLKQKSTLPADEACKIIK